jgi:hypothetical protein
MESEVWTWADFLEEFKNQYFPRWIVEQREAEFQDLKQRGKTVRRYAADFTRLSKYCPHLVPSEADRIRRFINGLHPMLNSILIEMAPPTYSAVVDIASLIEQENSRQARHMMKRKRLRGRQGNGQRTPTHVVSIDKNPKEKTCHTCKKKGHLNKDCWFKNKHRRCFNCGDSKHKKKECPKLNQLDPRNSDVSNDGIEGEARMKPM